MFQSKAKKNDGWMFMMNMMIKMMITPMVNVLSLSVDDDDDEYQCENYDDGLVFFSLYFVVVMICCSKLENKTTKDII